MGSAQSSIPTDRRAVVVILGGGYAGVAAAKQLDAQPGLFVILIERKNYFAHNVSQLRALVDLPTAKQTFAPYTRLLKNGVVLQAEVTEVLPNSVVLHGRAEPIKFDYIVIATGSSYGLPTRVQDASLAGAWERLRAAASQVAAAQNIVVAGGGAVGVELAAEIAETYPKKSVTIVHSGPTLIHSEKLKPEFRTRVAKQVAQLGIKTVLNARIEIPADVLEAQAQRDGGGRSQYVTGLQQVTLSSGGTLPCELLLFSVGSHTNQSALKRTFGGGNGALDASTGRLRVNAHQQVDGYTHVFAAGDIAGTSTKRAAYASEQGKVAASNITALADAALKGEAAPSKALASFVPFAGHPLVLTLGRTGGVTQLMNAGESVWGSNVTSSLKSKGLFIAPQWDNVNAQEEFKRLQKEAAQQRKATPGGKGFPVSFDAVPAPAAPAVRDLSSPEDTAVLQAFATLTKISEDQARTLISQGLAPKPLAVEQDSI